MLLQPTLSVASARRAAGAARRYNLSCGMREDGEGHVEKETKAAEEEEGLEGGEEEGEEWCGWKEDDVGHGGVGGIVEEWGRAVQDGAWPLRVLGPLLVAAINRRNEPFGHFPWGTSPSQPYAYPHPNLDRTPAGPTFDTQR